MKKKLIILLSVLISAGAVFSPVANAIDVQINVGDRPYYQGTRDFWDWGWHWVWVPGHMVHHHWVHGYYIRQGDWNVKYVKHKHKWHHHHD